MDGNIQYRAEDADALIIQPLDAVTLIYHRRSGITHIVAEPTPQILAAMGDGSMTAKAVTQKLSEDYDLGDTAEAQAVVSDRLEELAQLGLVARHA